MALASRVERARLWRKVEVLLSLVASSDGGRERVRAMKGEMKRSRMRIPRW
jgi:hypothetical protein